MTISAQQCVVVSCDGCGDGCWEDGIPHFPTTEEAVAYVEGAGFVVVGHVVWCPDCARKRECVRLGHTYVDAEDPDSTEERAWRQSVTEHGVPFRTRDCEHCSAPEYDPPFGQLVLLNEAAGAAAVGLTAEGP